MIPVKGTGWLLTRINKRIRTNTLCVVGFVFFTGLMGHFRRLTDDMVFFVDGYIYQV